MGKPIGLKGVQRSFKKRTARKSAEVGKEKRHRLLTEVGVHVQRHFATSRSSATTSSPIGRGTGPEGRIYQLKMGKSKKGQQPTSPYPIYGPERNHVRDIVLKKFIHPPKYDT